MPPPVRRIDRDNLSARVHGALRQALMDGAFEPGQRLTIAALAAEFGTSATPVREAIFRLVSEHALEMRAATAVHVPRLDIARLREVQLIRMELEGAAAARAASRITATQRAHLAAVHERFLKAAATDPAIASKHNRDFHFGLLHAAELPILENIVENAWVLMGPFLRMFHIRMPRRQLAHDEHPHHHVLAALESGDGAAARAGIQQDISWGSVMIDSLAHEGSKEHGREPV